jgi:DNA-binding PadR family transcriptional regulator
MNDDMDQRIENLLRQASRGLKDLKNNLVDPPPRVRYAIRSAVKELLPAEGVHEVLPTLQREGPIKAKSAEEMKIEILKLLAQRKSMNGVQNNAALREFRLALKDAVTGAIYSLLWDLEESGLLAEPKEPSESGIREYSITPKGREQLQSPEARPPESSTLRLGTKPITG